MDKNRIERHLREGPPNEPAYAGRRFTPPPEAPSIFVARPAVRAAVPSLAGALLVVIGAVLVVLLRVSRGRFRAASWSRPRRLPRP